MFKVVSINVNGLRNNLKRVAVFNWIKDNDYDFALLQETHCSTDFEAKIWSSQWNGNAGIMEIVTPKARYMAKAASKN
ncbi:hypothetical protein MAR_008475 [Mya arenaria]|uniref:Endonuclease/exonuclease/phosphatase domain-containing protein n=1 Tax=Mya arenaria TaxID=6604 RepID=A0ABY7DZ89_MYAAR|nr:hypothetical protein MAR_008475 [Mya arenaria]